MLCAIGLFLYFQFQSGLDDGLNRTLSARAADLDSLASHDGLAELRRRPGLLSDGDLTTQVLSRDGAVLFSSSGPGAKPLLAPAEVRRAGGSKRYINRHERTRLLVRRTPTARGGVIAVAASLQQRERALELLGAALVIGGWLTLVVAGVAGYALSGAVLRPMERMRQAASELSEADPHARLPLPLAEDEVQLLGVTLNDMLERLERARERERQFVSDASHELRTPLAILKTEVDVALRSDNPPEALRAALRVAGEEADRLIGLAEDLLVIARSDAGHIDLDCRPTGALTVLGDVARRFSVRARERGRKIVIESGEDPQLLVDEPRVEQALSNLVDNALRHAQGAVTLAVERVDGAVKLHVRDEGPGVPEEFVPRAFERFSRAGANGGTGGSGLGLAIVGLIAGAHGGSAGLANRPDGGGSDAWLQLPVPVT
jgi:two-component system OmpR family sensor kinase